MAKIKFVDFKAVKAAITMEQLLEHYQILGPFRLSPVRLNWSKIW